MDDELTLNLLLDWLGGCSDDEKFEKSEGSMRTSTWRIRVLFSPTNLKRRTTNFIGEVCGRKRAATV